MATKGTADALIVAALAAGGSFTEAAAAAGISRTTVVRRMRSHDFRGAVAAARAELLEQIRGQLLGAAPAAIRTLREVGESGATPPAARVSAARAVLEHTAGGRGGFDLDNLPAAEVQAEFRALLELAAGHVASEALPAFVADVQRFIRR